MNQIAIIFELVAFFAMGILAGFGAYCAKEAIADKIVHRRIRRDLLKRFQENRPFASEELMREADKIANDEKESDEAREFAKRVYVIGRTAQAAQEENQDD